MEQNAQRERRLMPNHHVYKAPFYNRSPWNLVIGVGILVTLLYAIGGPWAIAGSVALIGAFNVTARITRWRDLRQKGYFGGRQVRDTWVYEERDGTSLRALTLTMGNTEPGHWELFLPSQAEWRTSVPGWAQDRQQEIVRRIGERLKSRDIHIGDDYPKYNHEESLASMERDGWSRKDLPGGGTLMTPPPRRELLKRLWRRAWRSE
jgi:hypothetical protein